MQLRVYFLFNQSKRVFFGRQSSFEICLTLCSKVAFVNGVFFIISIGIYFWILIDNTLHQKAEIEDTVRNACPTFKGGGRWAQWLPGAYNHSLFEILVMYFITTIFGSNAFRICSICVGTVQNYGFLFCQNCVKRAEVTHCHLIA